jgi:hypothetical protein
MATFPEFTERKLNASGAKKAQEARRQFNLLLEALTSASILAFDGTEFPILHPGGLLLPIIRTKLEEAFMFTLRAISEQQEKFNESLAKDWATSPGPLGRCFGRSRR